MAALYHEAFIVTKAALTRDIYRFTQQLVVGTEVIVMSMILRSVRRGLTNVLRFSGHDTREQFWPYCLLIFALMVLVIMAVMIRTSAGLWYFVAKTVFQSFPQDGEVTLSPSDQEELNFRFDETFATMPETSVTMLLAMSVVTVLLAAAVVRRLRDAGKSGYWAILPLPFFAISAIMIPDTFESVTGSGSEVDLPIPIFYLIPLLSLNNLLYLSSMVYLVVLLAGESDRELTQCDASP